MRRKDKKRINGETTFTLNLISEDAESSKEKPNLVTHDYVPETPLNTFDIHYLKEEKVEEKEIGPTEVIQNPDLFVSPILGVQNNTVISDREADRPLKAYENFMNNGPVEQSKAEIKRSFDLLNTEEFRDILINGHRPVDHKVESEGFVVEKPVELEEEQHTHSNYEYFTEEPKPTYQEPVHFEEPKVVEVDPLPWEDEDLTFVEEVEETIEEEVPAVPEPCPIPRPKPIVEPVSTPKPAYQKHSKKTKYVAPPLNLLKKNQVSNGQNKAWVEDRAEAINRVFSEFNYRAKVGGYVEGPAVTLFLIDIEPGTDVSKINSYTKTLTMRLRTKSLRIQDPIPGLDCAGIEIPNENRAVVLAGNLINNPKFLNTEKRLSFALGLNLNGEEVYADIEKMPHGLVAGATGSGKSVCINTLIISLIYNNTPEELRFVLIDPKMVELSIYNDIPHLAMPVITDAKKAPAALKWVCEEMDRRFVVFSSVHAKNLKAFNEMSKRNGNPIMPKIVVVIDELADLMVVAGADVEDYIHRIGAKARAAGIHIIVATQRPSTDVIKGTMKNNIPTRIAFKVTSAVDSSTILDHGGAEKLLGMGDMLFSNEQGEERIQGAYVTEEEIGDIVDYLSRHNEITYLVDEDQLQAKVESVDADDEEDEIFEEVAIYAVRNNIGSSNRLMQVFNISFNRANRILLKMEKLGILSGTIKGKPREVLVSEQELFQILDDNK